jgi:hypothetical protein
MEKIAMACPFTHQECTECPIYRGRHHYQSSSKQCQGSTDKTKGVAKSGVTSISDEFQALSQSVEQYLVLPSFPSTGEYNGNRGNLEIKLKIIDVENKTTRTCDFDETKEWNWDNPEMMRIIDGWQVTSMEMLFEIMRYKAEKGCEEVALYEAPRFMLLAGG